MHAHGTYGRLRESVATKKAAKKAKHVPERWTATRAGKPSGVRIAVMCTEEERDAWQRAAYARRTTLSDVARAAWGELAREVGVQVEVE